MNWWRRWTEAAGIPGSNTPTRQCAISTFPNSNTGSKSLLNDPLIDLGLGIAFTDERRFFKDHSRGGIYISRVIHQTFIDVKEEGTEAAAATIVEMSETSAGGGPIYFSADKPFLYVIKENSTGAILFMGKVGKPEYDG